MNPFEQTYFLPYQSGWRHDQSPLRLCAKSRQVGLTYIDSYDSVLKAGLAGGKDVWVMSRDEIQARQYIRMSRKWARVLGLAAKDHREQFTREGNQAAGGTQVLHFASGASIYALSSNPDAIVGKSGHVKLDEFALHREQRTLYAVAKPVIQWGGTLSVISTHRGVHTVFNQIIADIKEGGNPMGWSYHELPVQLAVEQGLVERINAISGRNETREDWLSRQRRECIDDEQWLQEYCCQPADENSAFLTFELITSCEETGCLTNFETIASSPNPLYLGVDVARHKDLCVLDVGEKQGDVVWDRLRIELQGRPFSEIEAELYRLLRLPNMKRVCIDATGMGLQMAERAEQKFGWKVEPITFTAAVKEELAYGLRADFQDRRLRICDDLALRGDLRGIRKEVTSSGNIRFAGESADSHCDRFWAKALRQHAARHKTFALAMHG
jgi:phage FluMu gp28-like protein